MKISEKYLEKMVKTAVSAVLDDVVAKNNKTPLPDDNLKLEIETQEDIKRSLVNELKSTASVGTMYDLSDLYSDELNNGQKIFFLTDKEENAEKLRFLNETYDTIEALIKDKNPSRREKVMKGIYAIKNSSGSIQYFTMIQLGRNGAEHNFCKDYMKTLYEVYQILDEKSEWTSMTDTSCDVCDDLYNFVVTFVLK